jgi:predicted nucleotidyltransferase
MLTRLRKCLGSEGKDGAIADIVVYGSAARDETARDVDILVLFRGGSLRERLERLQRVKEKARICLPGAVIDAKQALYDELFSPAFLARAGVLLDGFSIVHNKRLCDMMGFRSSVLFSYSLTGLSHSQKVSFNYVLAGRNGRGILASLGARRFVNGAVLVPMEHAASFEDVLKRAKVTYKKKPVLEQQ